MNGSRLPIRYAEGCVLLTAEDAWAYYRVPTAPYDFLTDDERLGLVMSVATGLSALREGECHLLIVPRSFGAARWAHGLDAATRNPSAQWRPYLRRLEQEVARHAYWRREVYLGVRLGARGQTTIARARRRVERAVGLEDQGTLAAEFERTWARKADAVGRLLGAGGLRARPAEVAEVRWLIRRCFRRGLDDSPGILSSTRLGAGALATLVEGVTVNGRRSVVVAQPEGQSHVAFLAMAELPEEIAFPGGEWLHHFEALDFPVEASVRFRLVPPVEAAKRVRGRLARALDQARHIGSSDEMPLALGEQIDHARELEYRVTRDRLTLVDAWPRLVVMGSTAEALEDRVAELIRDYADVGIGLARPSGDQLSLCEEAVPGSRRRVGAYQQHMPVTTFAASMFVATSELGDRRGPYLGETTGRARVPVHFDPLEVAQRNLPTVTTISGRPGGGKTTLAQLMAVQAAFRGTSVLYVDPKRETDGLAGLLASGDVQVIDLDQAAAGILDPWAVADEPDEGAMLAIDALKLLLPGLTSEEERIVARACEEQSAAANPSLGGVVRQLQVRDAADAQGLGDSLRYYERLRTARLLFSPGGSAPAAAPARLTILQMGGITLPDASTPRQDYTWAERAAVAVMFLAAALARRLAQRSRSEAKLLVFDEAWALTNSRQGRALIERLARMGRSQNTAVMLVSQNARDFRDESIRNCASAMFAFHAQDRNEAVAVLDLLGIAPTEEHVRAVVGLRAPLRNASDGSSAPGAECIFRDPDGRVGSVLIDLVLPELRVAFDTTPGPAARTVAEVV